MTWGLAFVRCARVALVNNFCASALSPRSIAHRAASKKTPTGGMTSLPSNAASYQCVALSRSPFACSRFASFRAARNKLAVGVPLQELGEHAPASTSPASSAKASDTRDATAVVHLQRAPQAAHRRPPRATRARVCGPRRRGATATSPSTSRSASGARARRRGIVPCRSHGQETLLVCPALEDLEGPLGLLCLREQTPRVPNIGPQPGSKVKARLHGGPRVRTRALRPLRRRPAWAMCTELHSALANVPRTSCAVAFVPAHLAEGQPRVGSRELQHSLYKSPPGVPRAAASPARKGAGHAPELGFRRFLRCGSLWHGTASDRLPGSRRGGNKGGAACSQEQMPPHGLSDGAPLVNDSCDSLLRN